MKKTKVIIAAIAALLVALLVSGFCIYALTSQDTAKLTVDTSGGKVKVLVDGAVKSTGSATVNLNVPVGATVTLEAEDNTSFCYWTDNTMNTCSEAKSFSFVMRTPQSYTAWFKPTEGSLVVYRNTNTTKQVLAAAQYGASDALSEHLAEEPVKYGYTFSNWNLDVSAINAKIASGESYIEVNPTYALNTNKYVVNVVGGTIKETGLTTGEYLYLDSITLEAGAAPQGQSFVAWKDSDGNVISDSSTVAVSVSETDTYTAEFSAEAKTYPANIVIEVAGSSKSLITTRTKFFVPKGKTLSEYGVVFTKNVNCDADDLKLDNVDGVSVKKASYTKKGGILMTSFSGCNFVNVRAYLIYTDNAGKEYTVYSDVCYGETATNKEIISLDIAADGTVKNDVENGVALNSNGAAKTVKKDISINKNVVSFTGGSSSPGVYTAFTNSSIDSELADGFSFEVMFKATSGDFDSTYVGIFDYCEGGGFGLTLYKNSNNLDNPKLYVELGNGSSGYANMETYINVGEWYHCVFSYNSEANLVEWYLNGEFVASKPTNGGFRAPTVWNTSSAKENYICVGGLTASKVYGKDGFKGDIAVCNLFEDAVSAADVTKMYNAVTVLNDEETLKVKELLDLKHELRVDANGDFKVVVFSDTQCSTDNPNNAALKETVNNLKTIVDREQPDLVLLAGDISYNMSSAQKLENYLNILMGYVEEKQIPWAHVYGNHDDECNTAGGYSAISKEEQQKVYESFEYCISKDVDGLFGVGNYVLPVLSYDGSSIAFNIWGLDSGAYTSNPINNMYQGSNYFLGKYEYIQKNQIDWYTETSALLEKYNGAKIPAMMYFHIPLQEFYTAWNQKTTEAEFQFEWEGEKNENISAATINCGLFAAILQTGDVKLVASGHDHINDFMVKYNGVKLCYTACTGTEVYHNDHQLGGRVIEFSTEDPWNIDTRMSYVQDRNPDNDLLNMTINNDGSVTNTANINSIVGQQLPLTSHAGASGYEKTLGTDETITRKYISFKGGATPGVYNIPANKLTPVISDGFSYEILFRVTDGSMSTDYVGILDMEEAGGFGLNLYKNSSDINRPTLKAEVAYADTWDSLTYTINVGEWYHCVYSYDGTNTALYINGELVKSATVSGAYRAPSFAKRAGEEYICIGACAQAWYGDVRSTGNNGFIGDIAICNIFVEETNAINAKAIYDEAKTCLTGVTPPEGMLLDLVIDAANQTVTNGAVSGPVLAEVTHEYSSKAFSTDATIGKDIVTFTPRSPWVTTDAYTLPTVDINSKLANGFSAEVYFYVNSYDTRASEFGILNYEEGGGFGLDVGASSTSGKVTLSLQISTTDGWKELSTEINIGEWVHCVFTYTGTADNMVYLYVNGQVKSLQLTSNYKAPTAFGSYAPYITIGASSQTEADRITQNGFNGSIATCRIYGDPVSASYAAALYEARNN